jgi:hypothetical protein
MISINKISQHGKAMLSILYAGLPQIIGISTFLLITTLAITAQSVDILAAYQAGSAVAALTFLGLAYSEKNTRINLPFLINYLTLLAICSIVYSMVLNSSSIIKINVVSVFFTVSLMGITQYIIYSFFGVKIYFYALLISSILVPCILIIDTVFLIVITIAIVITIFFTVKKFNISINSNLILWKPAIKSLLVQTPFLIYPIFDFILVELISENFYIDYVQLSKVTIGFGAFIFSRLQLLTLSGNFFYFKLKSDRFMALLFCGILIFTIYLDNYLGLIIQCIILSIVINLSSLTSRALLKSSKIKYFWTYLPLTSFLLYPIFLYGAKLGVINGKYFLSVLIISFLFVYFLFNKKMINKI